MSQGAGADDPLAWSWLGTMEYGEAWALQRSLAAERRRGHIGDVVLMLEHPAVFTFGRQGERRHLGEGPAALRAAGADFVEVDRGGSVTFHGPGQLVAYPIVDLSRRFPVPGEPAMGDVLRYVRALEQAIIDTAAEYDVVTGRRPPYTGVWRESDKLAAIGVKLAGGVTTHGAALNVCTDLRWFGLVTPCGIDDGGVCSLESLGVPGLRPEAVAPRLVAALARAFAVPAASGAIPARELLTAAA